MYIIYCLFRRGRALIFIRLVFVTLGPLPNPDKILEVVNTLLKARLTAKQGTPTQDLSDSVKFASVNYTSKFFSRGFAAFCSEYVITILMLLICSFYSL